MNVRSAAAIAAALAATIALILLDTRVDSSEEAAPFKETVYRSGEWQLTLTFRQPADRQAERATILVEAVGFRPASDVSAAVKRSVPPRQELTCELVHERNGDIFVDCQRRDFRSVCVPAEVFVTREMSDALREVTRFALCVEVSRGSTAPHKRLRSA
jgi:hypothetical protein